MTYFVAKVWDPNVYSAKPVLIIFIFITNSRLGTINDLCYEQLEEPFRLKPHEISFQMF